MENNTDIRRAAAIFINEKSQILLSRDKGSTKWQLLGGKIEEGELPDETLKRELKEELNADIKVMEFYKESPSFPAANDHGKNVKVICYFCDMLSAPEFIEEVEELRWFSKQDFDTNHFEYSHTITNFVIPNLVQDGILT